MKTLLTLAVLCPFIALAQTDSTTNLIVPEQAKASLGKKATICGKVVSVVYTDRQGAPIYLNFNKDYPNQPFSAVIWAEDVNALVFEPMPVVKSRQVCVSGVVTEYKGHPQIIVRKKEQLLVQ